MLLLAVDVIPAIPDTSIAPTELEIEAASAPRSAFWAAPACSEISLACARSLTPSAWVLTLQETSEFYGNCTGDRRHGVSYDGATQVGLNMDTGKALGLNGGLFSIDALQSMATGSVLRALTHYRGA